MANLTSGLLFGLFQYAQLQQDLAVVHRTLRDLTDIQNAARPQKIVFECLHLSPMKVLHSIQINPTVLIHIKFKGLSTSLNSVVKLKGTLTVTKAFCPPMCILFVCSERLVVLYRLGWLEINTWRRWAGLAYKSATGNLHLSCKIFFCFSEQGAP